MDRIVLKRIAGGIAWLLVGGSVVVLMLGLLGEWWWVFDLLNHFRIILIGGALLGLIAALLHRHVRLIALGAVTFGWAALDLAPLYVADDAPAGAALVVEIYNVNRTQGDPARVAAQLAASEADVIGLIEVDQRWFDALAPALSRWPHRLEHDRGDNFGLALYAKAPLVDARIETPGRFPVLRAEVGGVGLLLVHPPPPVSARFAAIRDRAFAAYAIPLRYLPPQAVVMGDFNATPWSRPFRTLLSREGLREGRDLAGAGLGGSWPVGRSVPTVLPIDHVLVRGGLGVSALEVLGENGSDHRPVRAVIRRP